MMKEGNKEYFIYSSIKSSWTINTLILHMSMGSKCTGSKPLSELGDNLA